MRKKSSGVYCVSSGHEKHEWTSPTAIEPVFAYLCAAIGQKVAKSDDESTKEIKDADADENQ